MRRRAVPALGVVVADEPIPQRFLRRRLQHRVERGADPQPAAIDAVAPGRRGLAELRDQLAADVFEEIVAGDDLRRRAVGDRDERLGARRRRLARRDIAVRRHLPEHIVPPRQRPVEVRGRRIGRRRLRQDREIGVLREVEVGDRLAEVRLRRRLDAVAVPPEEDLVEVQLEDLFLGERRLDPVGEDRLLELADIADLAVQQQVLRHLLGDRRRALGPTRPTTDWSTRRGRCRGSRPRRGGRSPCPRPRYTPAPAAAAARCSRGTGGARGCSWSGSRRRWRAPSTAAARHSRRASTRRAAPASASAI